MTGAQDTGSSGTPAAALQGVQKFYGGHEILKRISFDVGEGEFLTLLGPSGCGKTTSLRVLAGFEGADQGEVILGGRAVGGLPPWRRGIGVVFQSYALFPYMTAAENVAFGLKMRRLPRAKIATRTAAALAQVGLAGFADRHPRHLSGGQRQRVALARALVIRPKLLLLDEPLSNLDAKLRGEMRYELKSIQRQTGVTTVFVTHDQEEAFSLSDKIVLMRSGEILQAGPPDALWTRPASAFVADFIGVENLIPATVHAGALRLAGGHEVRPASLRFAEGSAVVLGLRAADVSLVPAGSPGALPARILDAEYRGRERLYRLEAAGIEGQIRALAASDIAPPADVAVLLPEARMMVLKDDR